jgi:hypothetical protein
MKATTLLFAALAFAGAAFASAPVNPAQPMVTGRGNVDARPAKVIVTNQTSEKKAEEPIKLENFVVTGSLAPKAAVKAAAKPAPARR